MLYVAYGSNLNVQQMSYRCPGATVAFTGYLINWKLLYRGSHTGSYATVKRQKGSRVPVAVWNIDSKNEKALDLYEGYPRFYKKRNVFVQLKNGTRKKAMIYLLPDSATAGRPSSGMLSAFFCSDVQEYRTRTILSVTSSEMPVL